jgi:chemotaxis protein methyltransferase CheR
MPLTLQAFDYLRSLLHDRSAIVLSQDKLYLAEARLGALARQEGYAGPEAVVEALRAGNDRELVRLVIEAMTTNETSFFRDKAPFQMLQKRILPELIAARSSQRQLRIWSAACSSGQEVYSIAMLIRDHFPSLLSWDLRLLATDLNEEMLDRARTGRFSALEVSRGLPPDLLLRHFTYSGTCWVIQEPLRRMVEFKALNLNASWIGLGLFDLILLRNVLIYFDTLTKKTILVRLRQHLRLEGCLMLGTAETALNLDNGYESVHGENATYFRVLQPDKVAR